MSGISCVNGVRSTHCGLGNDELRPARTSNHLRLADTLVLTYDNTADARRGR